MDVKGETERRQVSGFEMPALHLMSEDSTFSTCKCKLSLHLCNSSRCEKLYFHNKPTPLLVIWQFPCQPKEFLHHCENHARLPEGRLETQFFYYLLENISVLLTVPTSLYLLGLT